MGRKIKRGLDFFPMNVDIASDIKIRKLIKYNKGQAFTVYSLLLCYIYKNGYYAEWDDDLPFMLSEQCGFDEEYITKVIEYCVSIELFDKDIYAKEKIITSRSIQERYFNICKQGGRKNPIVEYNLISSEEIPISSEEIPISSGKSTQTKQNKIKQNNNKQNNNIYPPPQTPPPCGEVASSSGRGGGRDLKNIYDGLCKSCSEREDVWEAVALSNFFMNDKAANYEEWLSLSPEQRKGYPLYQLNNAIRAQSPPIDTQPYHALCWCKDTCLDAEWREIYRLSLIHADELPKLVKECKKGKINLPGKFIISRLKAL